MNKILITLAVICFGVGIYWFTLKDTPSGIVEENDMNIPVGQTNDPNYHSHGHSHDHGEGSPIDEAAPMNDGKGKMPTKTIANNKQHIQPQAPVHYDPSGENELTEEQLEKLEVYFEKVEKDWHDKMTNLLTKELNLGDKGLESYEKLREGYEQEKLEAFQEFHEGMVEKYGEKYSYRPNQDEEVFDGKLRTEYQDQLRKLLGEDGYHSYKRLKDDYNDKLKSEQDPDLGVMLIEF